jgi:hypothetical protein
VPKIRFSPTRISAFLGGRKGSRGRDECPRYVWGPSMHSITFTAIPYQLLIAYTYEPYEVAQLARPSPRDRTAESLRRRAGPHHRSLCPRVKPETRVQIAVLRNSLPAPFQLGHQSRHPLSFVPLQLLHCFYLDTYWAGSVGQVTISAPPIQIPTGF